MSTERNYTLYVRESTSYRATVYAVSRKQAIFKVRRSVQERPIRWEDRNERLAIDVNRRSIQVGSRGLRGVLARVFGWG